MSTIIPPPYSLPWSALTVHIKFRHKHAFRVTFYVEENIGRKVLSVLSQWSSWLIPYLEAFCVGRHMAPLLTYRVCNAVIFIKLCCTQKSHILLNILEFCGFHPAVPGYSSLPKFPPNTVHQVIPLLLCLSPLISTAYSIQLITVYICACICQLHYRYHVCVPCSGTVHIQCNHQMCPSTTSSSRIGHSSAYRAQAWYKLPSVSTL